MLTFIFEIIGCLLAPTAIIVLFALFISPIIKLYKLFEETPTENGAKFRDVVKDKGLQGELIVRNALGKNVAGEKYIVNNLLISDGEHKSSQIDHVLINRNGIFVIETKNYSGRIYGSERDQEWTQVLNYGRRKYKHYNPLRQNATHIYRLKQLTGTTLPLNSAVVLVNNTTKYIDAEHVYTLNTLKKAISSPGSVKLSGAEMEEFYQKLLALKEGSQVSERQHLENIATTIDNVENGICPRCGGKLVEKRGKYGKFTGCENYPKCKFIKRNTSKKAG